MGKRRGVTDLPSFDDWLAPWETDGDGKEIDEDKQVIDKDRLARYIYDLQADKVRLGKSVETVTAERDEARTQAEANEREGETEVERLKRENEALKAAPKKDDAVERRETALDYIVEQYPHLSLKAARRLSRRIQGQSEEEIHEDVDDTLESLGLDKAPAGTDTDDGEQDQPRDGLRRTPRAKKGRTGGDPQGSGEDPSTLDGKSLDDLIPPQFTS